MVTDRVGPTITTLKAEVDYLDGEVKKLLKLLADARAESMKLRAALREAVEFIDQAEMALTPHGETYVTKWRAALEGK